MSEHEDDGDRVDETPEGAPEFEPPAATESEIEPLADESSVEPSEAAPGVEPPAAAESETGPTADESSVEPSEVAPEFEPPAAAESEIGPPADESSVEPSEVAPGEEPLADDPDPFAELVKAGPWKRYFARQIDLVVPALASLGLALATGSPSPALWSLAVVGVLPVFLWIVPEALLLAYAGNTPGKWLMGLKVATPDGSRPLLDHTLRRSVSVAVKGMALNVPFLNLFAPIRAYQRLRTKGNTSWDERLGFQVVQQRNVGPVQAGVVVVIATLVSIGASRLLTSTLADQGIGLARSQAEGKMRPVRDEIRQLMAERSVDLKRVGDPFTPLVEAGKTVSHTITVEEGVGRLAIATCDADCLDLDMAVVGPDGYVIAEDYALDAEPVALFLAPETGEYTIMLEMPRCTTPSCLALLEVHDVAGYTYESGGTCFVVSDEGHVLTAKHVVEGSDTITITLGDGRMRTGELATTLPDDDVALLRVDARTPEFLRLASRPLRLGDRVMTIGFPLTDILGSSAKYSEGTIAALNGPNGDPFLFQMSAQVQPGSSGGPVLDRDGAVVGLVTATADEAAFLAETGSMPQAINWATQAFRFRELVPAPGAPSTAPRSVDVVERSRRAVCRVEARFEARGE